jgi:hypothetical protein
VVYFVWWFSHQVSVQQDWASQAGRLFFFWCSPTLRIPSFASFHEREPGPGR